jgi:hypothetical protein
MYAEAKKLHLIEELLKVESDAVLAELETVLSKFNSPAANRKSFKTLVGTLSAKEVDELELNIQDGCEQINEDDWK